MYYRGKFDISLMILNLFIQLYQFDQKTSKILEFTDPSKTICPIIPFYDIAQIKV